MIAMPPELATAFKKLACSGDVRPELVLHSMAVNTASVWPTCSGRMMIDVQPIISEDPGVSPKRTGTAVLPRDDHAMPTLLRNTVAKRDADNRTERRMLDSDLITG